MRETPKLQKHTATDLQQQLFLVVLLRFLFLSTSRYMPKFSISDAALRAGVERTTLYRKLHKGDISAEIDAHGVKVIDASELLRVYPEARVIDAPATPPQQLLPVEKQLNATADATGFLMREMEIRDERIQEMKQRIESLEADKADLRSERDRLLKVIEDQSTSVKLLTAGDNDKEKTGKRSWFFRRRR